MLDGVDDTAIPQDADYFGAGLNLATAARLRATTNPGVVLPRMPVEKAHEIYADTYIKPPAFDLVLAKSPAVGTKLVDIGVNAGPSHAGARWFQQALNDLSRGGRDFAPVTVDGAIGAKTMAAYAALEKRRGRIKPTS